MGCIVHYRNLNEVDFAEDEARSWQEFCKCFLMNTFRSLVRLSTLSLVHCDPLHLTSCYGARVMTIPDQVIRKIRLLRERKEDVAGSLSFV